MFREDAAPVFRGARAEAEALAPIEPREQPHGALAEGAVDVVDEDQRHGQITLYSPGFGSPT